MADQAKTTALAKPIKEWRLAEVGITAIADTIEANMEGESLTEFDITKATWPSGKTLAFSMPTLDGDTIEKEIVGVIIAHGMRRAYWEQSIDEAGGGKPPNCASMDGRLGKGQPGGRCKTCPMSDWGSAKATKEGEEARGQACKQRHLLFIMTPERVLPIAVSVPPSSLKESRAYMTRLTEQALPCYSVVTKIGLVKDKNQGGVEYGKATFEVVRKLDDDEKATMSACAEAVGNLFRQTQADFDERPADDPEFVDATATPKNDATPQYETESPDAKGDPAKDQKTE